MARKIVFVFFIIIVVVASIWLKQSPSLNADKRQSEHKTSAIKEDGGKDEGLESTPERQPKSSLAKPETGRSQSPMTAQEFEQTTQAMLYEIRNRKYSDDDFIEIASLLYQQVGCYGVPSSEYLQGASDKANEVLAQSAQKCEQDKIDYPTIARLLESQSIDEINNFLMSIPTFEPEGEMMKSLISEQRFARAEERMVLSTKNPLTIMFDAWGDLIMGRDTIFSLDNSAKDSNQPDLLLGLDGAYQKTVNGLAKMLIACSYRNDQICSANSPFMATQCADNESVCGLNVLQWYQKFIMPGMKKDVEIMRQYYKSITEE